MKIHIVKQGDSIASLAEKFGMEKEALLRANPEIEEDSLEAGMKVKLPGEVKPVAQAEDKDLFKQTDMPAKPVGSFYDMPTVPGVKEYQVEHWENPDMNPLPYVLPQSQMMQAHTGLSGYQHWPPALPVQPQQHQPYPSMHPQQSWSYPPVLYSSALTQREYPAHSPHAETFPGTALPSRNSDADEPSSLTRRNSSKTTKKSTKSKLKIKKNTSRKYGNIRQKVESTPWINM